MRRYLAPSTPAWVTCERDFSTVLSTRSKTRPQGPFEGLGQMEGQTGQVCPTRCAKDGECPAIAARIPGCTSRLGSRHARHDGMAHEPER